MKKTIYFRACKDKKGFNFKADEGYLLTFYNGFGSVDLVIGKNQYNLWTITELTTGFLFHNSTFITRREAIEAITADYLKKALEKMQNWQWFENAQIRLAKYRAENQV